MYTKRKQLLNSIAKLKSMCMRQKQLNRAIVTQKTRKKQKK